MDINKIKIAICSNSDNAEGDVSNRFARCDYYTVYDSKTLGFTFVENTANKEMSGAGAKAAKLVSTLGVDVVLVPELGPKAFEALEAFEIKAYQYGSKTYSVRDALYEFYENKLPQLLNPSGKSKHS
jgi:predicted Fe-Mo cluster-binding NifX family protein